MVIPIISRLRDCKDVWEYRGYPNDFPAVAGLPARSERSNRWPRAEVPCFMCRHLLIAQAALCARSGRGLMLALGTGVAQKHVREPTSRSCVV